MPNAIALALAGALPNTAPVAGWVTSAGFLPASRSGQGVVGSDGNLVYQTQGGALTLFIFDPATGTVTTGPAPTGTNYQVTTGAFAGGKLWVIGGYNAGASTYSSVTAYTPAGANGATGTWASVGGGFPGTGQAYLSACSFGGFVYTAGGAASSNASFPTVAGAGKADAYRMDPATGSFTALAPMPQARIGGGFVGLGGRLYYLGGTNTSGSGTTTMFVYDLAGGTWSTHASPLPVGNSLAGAVAFGGFIHLPANATVYRFDPSTGTWTTAPSLNVTHNGNTLVATNSQMVAIAGGTATIETWDPTAGNYSAKVRAAQQFLASVNPVAYAAARRVPANPPELGWVTIGTANAAFAARAAASASDGGNLIYRAQAAAVQILNTASGVVTNGPTGGIPSVSNAAGAWLGGRFLHLGGSTNGAASGAVGGAYAYTPAGVNGASGTWATLPGSYNQSNPVYAAAAATLGQFVYSAGGVNDAGTLFDRLQRFDFTSNAWTALQPLPASRYFGALVALPTLGTAGRLLYIAGGNSSGQTVATILVYDVASNTWSTSPTAVPAPNFTVPPAAVYGTQVYFADGGSATAPIKVLDAATMTISDMPRSPAVAHGTSGALHTVAAGIVATSGGSTNVDLFNPAAAANYAAAARITKALAALAA